MKSLDIRERLDQPARFVNGIKTDFHSSASPVDGERTAMVERTSEGVKISYIDRMASIYGPQGAQLNTTLQVRRLTIGTLFKLVALGTSIPIGGFFILCG